MKNKTIKLFVLLCSVLGAGASYAINDPQPSEYDSRIQYTDYNEQDVVQLNILPGIGTRIIFAPGERITYIASGFTAGWEFVDVENILYIKARSVSLGNGNDKEQSAILEPEPGKWDTNLMITTNLRLYDFDLRLVATDRKASSQQAVYRVQFRYPDDERSRTNNRLLAQHQSIRNVVANPMPIRNTDYSMTLDEGSKRIAPTQAYDNGLFTYLKFPNNRDFPTVTIVTADGKESLIDNHVEGDVLVLHRVAPQFVLRLGSSVVTIHNNKYDADGVPPVNGTTVPNTQRIIIGE